jgi:hypothetical protein
VQAEPVHPLLAGEAEQVEQAAPAVEVRGVQGQEPVPVVVGGGRVAGGAGRGVGPGFGKNAVVGAVGVVPAGDAVGGQPVTVGVLGPDERGLVWQPGLVLLPGPAVRDGGGGVFGEGQDVVDSEPQSVGHGGTS